MVNEMDKFRRGRPCSSKIMAKDIMKSYLAEKLRLTKLLEKEQLNLDKLRLKPISDILKNAETRLSRWVKSLPPVFRSSLSIDLMTRCGSEDPASFLRRGFRADCVLVVGFILWGNKEILAPEEISFLSIVIRCTHGINCPTPDLAIAPLLTDVLQKRTPKLILSIPCVARVLPKFEQVYADMRASLFILAIMAARIDGGTSEAEQQALDWMKDSLPENIDEICVDLNSESGAEREQADQPKQDDSTKQSGNANSQTDSEKDMEKAIEDINGLVGLSPVKKELQRFINMMRISKAREKQGLDSLVSSMHMVFSGNPGTGKTTVARLVGRILRGLGMLQKGHVIEVERSLLVGEYVGQTAPKTLNACKMAVGGILFVDEAYALASGDGRDFGREAIETLLKFMEDNRTRMAVIVAGYTEKMREFINENPGLQSRFNLYIEFPDYGPEELLEIFQREIAAKSYILDGQANDLAAQAFVEIYQARDEKFGNARTVRNFFERTISMQADRLASSSDEPSKQDLITILREDFPIKEFAPSLASALSSNPL